MGLDLWVGQRKNMRTEIQLGLSRAATTDTAATTTATVARNSR